jgi:hypothetical protein
MGMREKKESENEKRKKGKVKTDYKKICATMYICIYGLV